MTLASFPEREGYQAKSISEQSARSFLVPTIWRIENSIERSHKHVRRGNLARKNPSDSG